MSEAERPTVGQILRTERERKNLSLESVAAVTRIGLENLKALERDDFRAISAPVFARGFLRTYASHLALDPKEILARYESQIDLVKASPKTKESAPAKRESSRSISRYLALVFLLGIGVAVGFYLFQIAPAPPPTASNPAPPAAPPQTADVQAPPPPAPAPPERASAAPPVPAEKPPAQEPEAKEIKKAGEEEKKMEGRQVLRAMAREKTWMRVKPDDQPVSDVLLQPGQTASWSAGRRFHVIIGNAGGADLSLNGASLGPLGKSGEVVTLTLPREDKTPEPVSHGEAGRTP